MRWFTATALVALPLFAIPAHANDLTDQAQRFLQGGNGSDEQERAYERGRQDEMRNRQAQQRNREYNYNYGNDGDRYRNNGYTDDYRRPNQYR